MAPPNWSAQPECDMDRPLISVIIPTWNCADYLPSTLESVFAQTWPHTEIIVVDDGSTDATQDLLATYGNRLVVVRIENSGGPSRPRNKGIDASHGDFIAFFDSDDLMEPDKLSSAMAVFESHPGADLVCSAFRGINTQGDVLKDDWLEDYQLFRQALTGGKLPDVGLMDGQTTVSQLIRANFVGTSSMVVRAETIKNVGPFIEDMKNSDDNEMWFRLARNGCTLAFIDRVLHSYRVMPGGISARGWRRMPAVIQGLEIQRPFISDPQDLQLLQKRTAKAYFALGWGLRLDGQYDKAIEAQKESLRLNRTLRTFMALQRSRLGKVFKR
jgi:teichuronic acid biosynthesis glycosyltransferase TuaG